MLQANDSCLFNASAKLAGQKYKTLYSYKEGSKELAYIIKKLTASLLSFHKNLDHVFSDFIIISICALNHSFSIYY